MVSLLKKLLLLGLIAATPAWAEEKIVDWAPFDALLPEVDTTGNTVGIEKGDRTFFIDASTPEAALKLLLGNSVGITGTIPTMIITQKGKMFINIGQSTSAKTGTPGHLMYKNYIGTIPSSDSGTPGMPGSGKRIDLCNGKCEKITPTSEAT